MERFLEDRFFRERGGEVQKKGRTSVSMERVIFAEAREEIRRGDSHFWGDRVKKGVLRAEQRGGLIFFFWILGEVSENKTLKRGEENELGEEKNRER